MPFPLSAFAKRRAFDESSQFDQIEIEPRRGSDNTAWISCIYRENEAHCRMRRSRLPQHHEGTDAQ